jgi:hypothetical protein
MEKLPVRLVNINHVPLCRGFFVEFVNALFVLFSLVVPAHEGWWWWNLAWALFRQQVFVSSGRNFRSGQRQNLGKRGGLIFLLAQSSFISSDSFHPLVRMLGTVYTD